MISYREQLPQMGKQFFLTDGGLETTLIFHEKIDLPHFSAITLLAKEHGIAVLNRYFQQYLALAQRYKTGFILESPTWRGSSTWAEPLGYSKAQLAELNVMAINQLHTLKLAYENNHTSIVISGCVGPKGDAYDAQQALTALDAEHYHSEQITLFNQSGVDMVTALTLNSTEEAIGIVHAAQAKDIPVVISFTVETNGCLPDGHGIFDAIAQVDSLTDFGPAYYMINCAHPSHFIKQLQQAETNSRLSRIRGVRANASCKSHAELDEAVHLDEGDVEDLAQQYARLLKYLPDLTVFGGCCGTDVRHVEAVIQTLQGEMASL